jgi:hypothetical protein
MRKLVLLFGLLVVAQIASAQSIALPNSACSFQASNYLFCSQMGNALIGTDTYAISSNFAVTNVYQWGTGGGPASGTFTGNITFQDVSISPYTYTTETVSGTFSLNADGTHHLEAGFSGTFTGSLAFDVVTLKPSPCSRFCYARPFAENVLLTIN